MHGLLHLPQIRIHFQLISVMTIILKEGSECLFYGLVFGKFLYDFIHIWKSLKKKKKKKKYHAHETKLASKNEIKE